MKQTGKLTVCRPTVIGSIDDQSRYSFDQRDHVKFVELGLFFYLEGVVTFNTPTFPRTDDANQGTRHPRNRNEQANTCGGADQLETTCLRFDIRRRDARLLSFLRPPRRLRAKVESRPVSDAGLLTLSRRPLAEDRDTSGST